eukprot:g32190.t1
MLTLLHWWGSAQSANEDKSCHQQHSYIHGNGQDPSTRNNRDSSSRVADGEESPHQVKPDIPRPGESSESRLDAALMLLPLEEEEETLLRCSGHKRWAMVRYTPTVSESESEELDLGQKRLKRSYKQKTPCIGRGNVVNGTKWTSLTTKFLIGV